MEQTRISGSGAGSSYLYRSGTANPPPFNTPSPYTRDYSRIDSFSRSSNAPDGIIQWMSRPEYVSNSAILSNARTALTVLNINGTWGVTARNNAREALVDELGEKLGSLENLLEHREAAAMIAKRLVGLKDLYKGVRTANFRMCYDALKSNLSQKKFSGNADKLAWLKKNWRTVVKTPADLWLEFNFGWMPIKLDIDAGLTLLTEPVKPARFSVASRRYFPKHNARSQSALEYQTHTYRMFVRAFMGAVITIENPNQVLANRLGLADPLGSMYAVVPFSWLEGYFSNVGQVLGQFRDFYGYKIQKPWVSTKLQATGEATWSNVSTKAWALNKTQALMFRRDLGIPLVVPAWRRPDGLSFARLANMASVAAQFVASGKPAREQKPAWRFVCQRKFPPRYYHL